MAKLRRSTGRPVAAKKAKASAAATRAKARPAVKKSTEKPSRSAARKPAGAAPEPKPKKPSPAKPAPRPSANLTARTGAKVRPKPPAPAPAPRRSTYADAVVLYERGLQALQAKRYREAADTLRRVMAEFPEEIELHERARLYIRVCERQLAPLDATPKTPEEQVYAATLAINAGATDRAVALLTAALQQQSDNDAAEYMLGVALTLKGDQPSAIAHLTRAVELNPDTKELLRKEPELEALRQTDEVRAVLTAPSAAPRKDKRPQPRVRR